MPSAAAVRRFESVKVIYISVVRLTDKMAADWHIHYLIEKGVSVEYWDIVSLVREEHSERGALNPPWLHLLRSFEELEARLSLPANRDAFYVMLLSYAGRLTRVFRLLSKHDCRMLQFASGSLPHDPAYKWRKIAAWVASPHRLAQEIVSRVKTAALRRLKLVKPFTITFAAGDLAMNGSCYAARVVPINFFDYDYYLKGKTVVGRPIVTGRYAVFLDSNLPYHSDLTFVGYQRIDPACYYRSLNRFFALLEQAYSIKIVIAAHPRADYDSTTFEGREMHRLVTAELVRDAEFVLSHTSTAISFAVLNSKPLLFIYTEGMAVAYARSYLRQMHCFADCLGAPIYNVDAISDAREVCVEQVDRTLYERYKYNFLTSHESEKTSTQDIFWRAIRAQ
jgi:hypothetical protein